jgi:hypothetical protein
MNDKAKITRAITLLVQSDAKEAESLESYVQACETLHEGFDGKAHSKHSPNLTDYIAHVVEVSVKMGQGRSSQTFGIMFRIGRALAEKRVKRDALLACESRNEILSLVPVQGRTRRRLYSDWTSIRISKITHAKLAALAKKGESFDSVIGKLLPSRALRSVSKRKAA